MTSRCTGHCCRRFWLGFSKEEIEDLRAQGDALADPSVLEHRQPPDRGNNVLAIARMVVFLEADNGSDCNGDPKVAGMPKGGAWYTCKNFIDGNCLIYENRPRMCRDYPYRAPGCSYKLCTWKSEDQMRFLQTLWKAPPLTSSQAEIPGVTE